MKPKNAALIYAPEEKMLYISGSQTCSSHYPNQGSDCLNYPQYFAVVSHKIELHCGFGSALPQEVSHITPEG